MVDRLDLGMVVEHLPAREGSAQDLFLIIRRHYQPKTAFPFQLSFCVRF
jgi:hypothetical protein